MVSKREKVEYGFKRWILNHTDKFSISQLAPFEAHELAWVFLDRQDEFLTGILIKGLLLFGSLIVLVSARWKSNCDSYEVTSAIGQLPKHLIRKFFSAKRQFIEQVLSKVSVKGPRQIIELAMASEGSILSDDATRKSNVLSKLILNLDLLLCQNRQETELVQEFSIRI